MFANNFITNVDAVTQSNLNITDFLSDESLKNMNSNKSHNKSMNIEIISSAGNTDNVLFSYVIGNTVPTLSTTTRVGLIIVPGMIKQNFIQLTEHQCQNNEFCIFLKAISGTQKIIINCWD